MGPARKKHSSPSGSRIGTKASGRLKSPFEKNDILATFAQSASFLTDHRGGKTHALIPFDAFEYMVALQAAREGAAILEDDNEEWVDADDLLVEFAAPNLAKHRKFRGLTQKQLADRLGVPQSQVARMERNPKSVTFKTLERVAKALGCDLVSLLA